MQFQLLNAVIKLDPHRKVLAVVFNQYKCLCVHSIDLEVEVVVLFSAFRVLFNLCSDFIRQIGVLLFQSLQVDADLGLVICLNQVGC